MGGCVKSTVCGGVGPEAMTVAVAIETGKEVPVCTEPPGCIFVWTTGIGAI